MCQEIAFLSSLIIITINDRLLHSTVGHAMIPPYFTQAKKLQLGSVVIVSKKSNIVENNQIQIKLICLKHYSQVTPPFHGPLLA